MNLKNLTELELYFANHFDTVLFPVLADIYQSKGEYDRAKRVCEIGLEHHPPCIDAYYILSQAEKGLGNLTLAEKRMKKVFLNLFLRRKKLQWLCLSQFLISLKKL